MWLEAVLLRGKLGDAGANDDDEEEEDLHQLCQLGRTYFEINARVQALLLTPGVNLLEQSVLESMHSQFLDPYLAQLCVVEEKATTTTSSVRQVKSRLDAFARAMPEMLVLVEYVFGGADKSPRLIFPALDKFMLTASPLMSKWCEQAACRAMRQVMDRCVEDWLATGRVSPGAADFFFIVDTGATFYTTQEEDTAMYNQRHYIDFDRLPTTHSVIMSSAGGGEVWARRVLFCGLARRFLLQHQQQQLPPPILIHRVDDVAVADLERRLRECAVEEFRSRAQLIRDTLCVGQANVFYDASDSSSSLWWRPRSFASLDSSSYNEEELQLVHQNCAGIVGQRVLPGGISIDHNSSSSRLARAWFRSKVPVEDGFSFTVELGSGGGGGEVSLWVVADTQRPSAGGLELTLVVVVDSGGGRLVLRCQDEVLLEEAVRTTSVSEIRLTFMPNGGGQPQLHVAVASGDDGAVATSVPCPLLRRWADGAGNCFCGVTLWAGRQSSASSSSPTVRRLLITTPVSLPQPSLNLLPLFSSSSSLVFTPEMLETWNAGAFRMLFRVSRTRHQLTQRGLHRQPHELTAYHQVCQAILHYLHLVVIEPCFYRWRQFVIEHSSHELHRFSADMANKLNSECCLGNALCRRALLRVLRACDAMEPLDQFTVHVRALLHTLQRANHAAELVAGIDFNGYWTK